MRVTPKLNIMNLQKFILSLYVAFHQAILACLDKIAFYEKFLIPEDVLNLYKDLVAQLTDRNNQQQARLGTEQQAEDDAERDRLLSFLFFAIQNGLRSTKEAVLKAAKQLEIVIRAYADIQRQAYAAETASIRGLIEDLAKEENAEAVAALNLQTIIDELQTANEAFDAKWTATASEAASRSRQLSTAELRRQTDDVFNELCERIYAAGFVAPDEDTIKLVTDKINEINGIIDSYKKSYNRSAGQKKKEEEEGGEGGDTPEEGGEPQA